MLKHRLQALRRIGHYRMLCPVWKLGLSCTLHVKAPIITVYQIAVAAPMGGARFPLHHPVLQEAIRLRRAITALLFL